MKICMFSSKAYDEKFFSLNNSNTSEQLDISYFSSHLNEETVYMAEGF